MIKFSHPVCVRCLRLLAACLLLLCGIRTQVQAQFYPVQVTPQLVPPYSVYLSDYAIAGNEKLRVILLQRDMSQASYHLRLKLSIELNGREIIRTSNSFQPRPIIVEPGIPTVLSGADLAPYLDSRNMEFIGYSREQYERTRSLPEGAYRICFRAYDYRRQDVKVSDEGCSFYYLAKNEPPMVNFPACGSRIIPRIPQQLIFSWLPRNTASPNSAADTEYELSLYEVRPQGRNPNDIVASTPPVFRTTVSTTQYVYGPADPVLLDSMQYVWRVQAKDRGGRDAFRNQGYSEVCTFHYGGSGSDTTAIAGQLQGLQAEAETERKAKIWWSKGSYDSYRVNYKKKQGSYEWFASETTSDELWLFDLEADTEYEVRAQGKKGAYYGPYSPIISFRTPLPNVVACGEGPTFAQGDLSKPLPFATAGMIIEARGMEVQLTQIQALGDGYYKGLGRVSIPYLGGAVFTVKFDQLYIDEARVAGAGRIDFLTQGVAAMAEEQFAAQAKRQREAQQAANRAAWAGTAFHEKIFRSDNIAIDKVTVGPDGTILIEDASGQQRSEPAIAAVLTANPDQAVIIQDKNGDQWVVQKDAGTGETKVTKVEGGGLPPSSAPVPEDILAVVKKAMQSLRRDYTDSKVNGLQQALNRERTALEQYIQTANGKVIAIVPASGEAGTSGFYEEIIEEETTPVVSDDPFKEKSKAYKLAERAYNKAMVVKTIASESRSTAELTLIVNGTSYQQKPLLTYLQEAKQNGSSEEKLISDAKEAITSLIEQILNQYVYSIE